MSRTANDREHLATIGARSSSWRDRATLATYRSLSLVCIDAKITGAEVASRLNASSWSFVIVATKGNSPGGFDRNTLNVVVVDIGGAILLQSTFVQRFTLLRIQAKRCNFLM